MKGTELEQRLGVWSKENKLMSTGDQVLVLLGKEKKNRLTCSLHVAIKMFSLEWAWLHVGYLTGKGSKEMEEKVVQTSFI